MVGMSPNLSMRGAIAATVVALTLAGCGDC